MAFRTTGRTCLLVVSLFLVVSCIDIKHWGPRAKRERELELSASLQAGSSFHASTKNGSVSVQGTEADECRVTAKIHAYAVSKEKAEELAEAIQVRLERSGGGVEAIIEAPSSVNNADYSVSLTVAVPRRTALKLTLGDGRVRITNVDGSIKASTANGDVEIENAEGDIHLKSYNGAVTCSQIEGGTLDLYTSDGNIRVLRTKVASCKAESSNGMVYLANVQAESLDLHTSDGGIRCQNVAAKKLNCNSSNGSAFITWAPDAPRSPDITVALADGHITFVGIAGMSAVLDIFTNSGQIHADLPDVPKGGLGKSLQTTLGEGGGRLMFTTHDGSITIR